MSDTKDQYRDADTHTTVRLHNPTHSRVKDHNRESETLAGTIDRALDALERQTQLLAAVSTHFGTPDKDEFVADLTDGYVDASEHDAYVNALSQYATDIQGEATSLPRYDLDGVEGEELQAKRDANAAADLVECIAEDLDRLVMVGEYPGSVSYAVEEVQDDE